MKRFNITVNGTAYDVAVEEVGAGEAAATLAPAAKQAAPAQPAKPAVSVTAGTKVVSPMPGTIVNVNVAVGDAVKEGQVVMILEAMKMENDIVAACDGKVASITVKKGDAVESNDVLLVIQ